MTKTTKNRQELPLDDVDILIDEQEDRKLFTRLVQGVLILGLVAGAKIAKTDTGIKPKKPITPANLFSVLPGANKLISEAIIHHHAKLLEKTTEDLGKILDMGIKEGLSNAQIASSINKKYKNFYIPKRSNIIARSMSTGIVNSGTNATYLQDGIKQKMWRATLDGRVRIDHATVHDETHRNPIPTQDYFNVGGWQAMYPGDINLPPSQSINCRCRVVNASASGVRCLRGDALFRDDQATIEELIKKQMQRYFRVQLKSIKDRINSLNTPL